jgi:tRNA dimethylallyltransferase
MSVFTRRWPRAIRSWVRASIAATASGWCGLGQSLAEWQLLKGEPVLTGDLLRYVLKPNREWLVARIAKRFRTMIGEGALEEVRALHQGGLADDLPAARALGVPSLMAHLDGRLSLDQAVEQAIVETRQYAKRQMTWFRHQMPDWRVLELSEVRAQATVIGPDLE